VTDLVRTVSAELRFVNQPPRGIDRRRSIPPVVGDVDLRLEGAAAGIAPPAGRWSALNRGEWNGVAVVDCERRIGLELAAATSGAGPSTDVDAA